MSFNPGNIIACPAIQQQLNGNFGFDPTTKRYVPPALRAILSDINTGDVLQNQIDAGNGHYRQVQVKYSQRRLISNVSSSPLDACTSGTNIAESSTTYEIDTQVGSWDKLSIPLADLADACEDDEFFVVRSINQLMDSVTRAMGQRTLTDLATLYGKSATNGTTAAITAATLDANGNYINDFAKKVNLEVAKQEMQGVTPFAISGDSDFLDYITAKEFACCTDALNINLAAYDRAVGAAGVWDKYATSQLGANDVALVAPGAVQLLTYNGNRGARGIRNIQTEQLVVGTLLDPVTGILFDYEATYDCKVWTFSVGIAHQLVGMPVDMFVPGDDLEGVTYVVKFQIDNP